MLRLHIKAPFATFRPFHTGSFRPTAEFITHSAAYGLLLNLAAIEMRRPDDKASMTLTRDDLPTMRIALGAVALQGPLDDVQPSLPHKATVFQQLHNYPVGTSGRDHAPNTKGNKYNITPVRREFLSGFQAILHVETDSVLEERIMAGLAGNLSEPRYGLPFLGDNSFLPDWVKLYDVANLVFWLRRVENCDDVETARQPTRLTQWIDRADSSLTRSMLFAFPQKPTCVPEAKAIVELPPS